MTENTLPRETLPGSFDALEDAVYYFDLYSHAKDIETQAHYFVQLSNAMDSLRSFHPGYDVDTGTMPWQRDDDE